MKKFITFTMIFMLLGLFAKAQVPMATTGSYFQDFDGLINTGTATWTDNSTLTNWWGNRTGSGTNIIAGNGSSNTGSLYSYGTISATDRAFGGLGSGSAGHFAIGIQLQNTSLVPISTITLSFVGEQWRDAGATTPVAQTASFYYKVSPTALTSTDPNANTTWTAVTSLNFTSPTFVNTSTTAGVALDGNAAANRTTITGITIPDLTIPAGSYIMLKWDDPNHTGNDHCLGVDSVAINWVVPANGVTTDAIAGSPFTVTNIAGTSIDVPFTAIGTFNAGNVFTAYLSNATGSFASETAIGNLSSLTSGTINAQIPMNTPSGTGYRVRVKASDPATTGTNNGTDLTINLNIIDVIPPVADTAFATSLSTIKVAFDEALLLASAETATHYTFTNGAVTGTATLSPTLDSVSLVLSTALLDNVTDTLQITGVSDSAGNAMTLTYKFPVLFTLNTPPVALTAYATSLSDVVVVFNEPLQNASAQNIANYTFGSAVVASATPRPSMDSVNLVLSTPLLNEVTDTLIVTGLIDSVGHIMTLTYKFPVVYSTTPPVADTAYATSLTNVVVVFDEALQTLSAENIANYSFITAAAGSAVLSTSTTVNLTLSTPLLDGVVDTLSITGIADVAGNIMTLTYVFPVSYIVPEVIDTIVYWNFPAADSIADGGILGNLAKVIGRESSFYSSYSLSYSSAPAISLRSTNWDAGTATKYWKAEFTTELYDNIHVFSVQRSSNTGPRSFRLEYSLDGSNWTPAAGGIIHVANNYTTGTLNNILLPADCNDAASLTLRWIMTSDTAVNNGIVLSTGASNIDSIYVTGRYNPILGIPCQDSKPVNFSVYPNPATGSFNLQLEKNAEVRVDIMNITGQILRSETRSGDRFIFDISDLSKGIYVIRLVNLVDQTTSVRKLSVQ